MKYTLPLNTEIDVVGRNDNKIKVSRMTYGDALKIKKNNGWQIDFFQIGYHSYKSNI